MVFILNIGIIVLIIMYFLYLYGKDKQNFIKKHFLFILVLTEFFLFTFISPLYGYLNNIHIIFGSDVGEYYDDIMIIYSIAIFSFFIGYVFFIGQNRFKMTKRRPMIISKKYIRFFFVVSLLAVLSWSKLTNFGITNLLFMEYMDNENFSGGYNYLLFMMEFSIGAMILAPFSDMKNREIILWTLLFGAIFLLFGFRYRLIMVLLVILSSYIIKNNFSRTTIKNFILVVFVSLFVFSLFSNLKNVGRSLGTKNNIETEIASLDKFGFYLHKNTNNYLHFMSVYKCIDDNRCNHDYGSSILLQTIYRTMPRYFFENNIKPEPLSLAAIAKSYGSREGLFAGGAMTNIGHFYYSFSVVGLIICMLMMGVGVIYLTNSFLYNQDQFSTYLYIVSIALSFHFISRGYVPGIFTDFIYIMFPMVVLIIINKFKRKRRSYV